MTKTPLWSLSFQFAKTSDDTFNQSLHEIFENITVFETKNQQEWLSEAILNQEPQTGFIDELTEIASSFNVTLKGISLGRIPDKDWLPENRASFPAIQIKPFYIHGSHLTPDRDENAISIQVDAACAFGTGSHATTRACLRCISGMESPSPDETVLDLGCGTAILAIAMAKLWKRPITATDIDHPSVGLAKKNVVINNVNDTVEVFHSDGFKNSQHLQYKPYGLIVANILAGPLIAMASDMHQHSSKGARLILSGLLIAQKEDVVKAYSNAGFDLIRAFEDQEWCALVMKKHD